MLIKIQIGSTTNKGDELMLLALSERLGQANRLLVEPQKVDERLVESLGMYRQLRTSALLWAKRLLRKPVSTLAWSAKQLAQRSSFHEMRFALVKAADAYIDASGYAYGDPWGSEPVEMAARLAAEFKRRNRPVIMMPQTFGPFKNERVRNSFLRLVEHVDLLFARDRFSYENVTSLTGPSSNIRIAPDYTSPVNGSLPSEKGMFNGRYACIIPSHRMLDSVPSEVANRYLYFLSNCVRQLSRMNIRPIIVLHDVRYDVDVAHSLKDAVDEQLTIIDEKDAKIVRGIIGKSYLVISSRFHGLINALIQGVPCLATEWTHKFYALMDAYGCGDFLVSPMDAEDVLARKLELLDDDGTRKQLIERIRISARKQHADTLKMWASIEKVLKTV